MARKFGSKVTVSRNMNDFMIGVMAPSGYGKSTLMYKVCDKLFGDEGYLLCDMGDENGTAAIDGVVAEKVPTWKKFKEIVDDIVKNKNTDYKELKVVILDTLDAAFECAEEFCVKAWNAENAGQQGFKMATSINSVEGGFGKGLERVIETVKKEINRLDKVGVRCWWTAHVKEKDQLDLFTGSNYTTLTANMPMKYFNSIRNISHVIGFGYFNRTIEKQEIGEANPVTKKKKTREAVLDESRRMKFRDSSMIADAKSRFSNIVEEINLDADEFITAIMDAIEAERKAPVEKKIYEPTSIVEETEPDTSYEAEVEIDVVEDTPPFDVDDATEEVDKSVIMDEIRKAFKVADATTKKAVKAILTEKGEGMLSDALSIEVLMEIKEVLS
jgi:hypothetical protein